MSLSILAKEVTKCAKRQMRCVLLPKTRQRFTTQKEDVGHSTISYDDSSLMSIQSKTIGTTWFLSRRSSMLFSTQASGQGVEVKRRTLKPAKGQMVTLTDRAIEHLHGLTTESNTIVKLYFVVKGCNGYAYEMEKVDVKSLDPMDELIVDKNGKPVLVIENKASFHLLGCHIDYEVSDVEEGFVFNNPNVTSKCGCGYSFQFGT
ncbi:hypothetical protein BgAZ_103910 [Babesia gibsoni]|uniref:Core domain-containing protein n=1 Tax=Babesia gibsoni TaxID=33632 RepID=A0AAD8PFW2_BABGI|nr:hypothetical protein BgAZ_103910 [Babesia gibsoni]